VPGRWRAFFREHGLRGLRVGAVTLATGALLVGGGIGWQRLDAHVQQEVTSRVERPALLLVDLPPAVQRLAEGELRAQLLPLLEVLWTEESLCPNLAERLSALGWVSKVRYVRRGGDGVVRVSCDYRVPVVMVQQGAEFLLVDATGTRVPGTYTYDPAWPLVQGVAARAPQPGERWEGDDLQAALSLWHLLSSEPFTAQITAVLVENYGGRRNRHGPHLELATDRAGGRIRWGSAPGREVEENTPAQKLALLRENHRRSGRADAGHAVIDISTFPDRFAVPG